MQPPREEPPRVSRVTHAVRVAIREDASRGLHTRGRYQGQPNKSAIARLHGVSDHVVHDVLRRMRDRAPSPPGRCGRPRAPENTPGALARAIASDPVATAAAVRGNKAATARAIGCSEPTLRRAWYDVEEFLFLGCKTHFKKANHRSREELLHRLRAGGFVAVSVVFYALSDPELCGVLEQFVELGIPVWVLIDRKWTKSCKIAIACMKKLVAAGVEVHHRRHMMHYKLITIMYPAQLWASAGSANMTKAAFTTNDDYLFETIGLAAFEAQTLFDQLWGDSDRTDPAVHLTPKKGNPFGSEPTSGGGEPSIPPTQTEPQPQPQLLQIAQTPNTISEPDPEPRAPLPVPPAKTNAIPEPVTAPISDTPAQTALPRPKRRTKKCSVEGCARQARKGGLYRAHSGAKCSEEGCMKPVYERGLCYAHKTQKCPVGGCMKPIPDKTAGIDTTPARPEKRSPEGDPCQRAAKKRYLEKRVPCRVDGCAKSNETGGNLCSTHHADLKSLRASFHLLLKGRELPHTSSDLIARWRLIDPSLTEVVISSLIL